MLGSPAFGLLVLCAALITAAACKPHSPPYTDEAMRELNQWLDSRRTTPGQLLAEEIAAGRRPVLIQPNPLRGDTVEFMRSLIPVIHKLGLDTLGVFFLEGAEQDAIDAYVLRGEEVPAPEELIIAADASLGYREYRDFITYVRDYNRRGNGESDSIRLVGLSGEGDTEADFLWMNGDKADGRISGTSAERPSVILLHYGPGDGQPGLNALVEDLRRRRAVRDLTFAFRPAQVSWAEAEDFPDIDIVSASSFPYAGVEPIPDFITPENIEAAVHSFPDIRMGASRINLIIRREARRYRRELRRSMKHTRRNRAGK